MADVFDILFSEDSTTRLYRQLKRALPDKVPVYLHTLQEKWNRNKGAAVVVADDSDQERDTAHDRVLVRVTVHAPTLDIARKLGRAINEYLLSPIGGFGLSISRTRSTGVIVGPDSLAGGYVATCSYSCGTSRKRIK